LAEKSPAEQARASFIRFSDSKKIQI